MNTLELICRLPCDYHKIQTKSMIQLVSESGYLQNNIALSTEAIENYLRSHPELVKEWITYSEDKRSSSGWYLEVNKSENSAIVGFHPKGEVFKFSDQFKACAKYIDLEVKELSAHAG